jgi:hypothetical protein
MGLTFCRELFEHPEEINSIRDKILDTAAELIIKEERLERLIPT